MSAASEKRVPTLAELQEWARNPTGDNWRNLLGVLTDLFLADIEVHTSKHGDSYAEIVCKLLDDVATEVRAELSQRIAPIDRFPDKVVRRLAHDEDASVAEPVLEHSPVLNDADLVEIIELMMPERGIAISRRKHLGKKVTDALVAGGDEKVILNVTSNPGAAFSDRTMRVVAEKAKRDPELCGKLVDRQDLTQAIVVQLTPFLSDELKARLRALDEPEGGSLLDSLSEIAGEVEKQAPSRKNRIEALAAVEQVRAGNASMDDTVARIAAVGHTAVLYIFISEMAGIPEKLVSTAFLAKNGARFAIICKTLFFSQKTFSAVAQLRARRVGTPQGELPKYIESYARLTTAEAEKSLKTMLEKGEGSS